MKIQNVYTAKKSLNKGKRPAMVWEFFLQWLQPYLDGAAFTNSQGHEEAQHLKSSMWLILDYEEK